YAPPSSPIPFKRGAASPKIEILDDLELPTGFVRIGLWQDAFDSNGILLDNNDNLAENFIKNDRRSFSIRITDYARRGTRPTANNPGTRAQITASWWTIHTNSSIDDNNNGVPDITLTETSNGSGVFTSRALMLVTDTEDQQVHTDAGRQFDDDGN